MEGERVGGGNQDSEELTDHSKQISASRVASMSHSQLEHHLILVYCVLILLKGVCPSRHNLHKFSKIMNNIKIYYTYFIKNSIENDTEWHLYTQSIQQKSKQLTITLLVWSR
jgi:hypothetical protein